MAEDVKNADQVREETRRHLGPDADYSYITDEVVKADSSRTDDPQPLLSGEASVNTVWYGNNARYGARTVNGVTYQGYWFENDGHGGGDGCSTAFTGFVTISAHHQYLGKCSSGRERWSFTF